MGAGKREIGLRMVETALLVTSGMTGEAGNTGILIPVCLLVAIIHPGLGMLVAVHTTENSIIARLLVTFGAVVPCIGVPARIHREETCVVLCKTCRFPAGVGGMAIQAGQGQVYLLMVRIERGCVILLMTGVAICRQFCEIASGMAKCTAYRMAACQREKAMFNVGPGPACCRSLMAFYAIGAVSGLLVIRFCSGLVGSQMAIDAVEAKWLETPKRSRLVTGLAIGNLVGTGEREPPLPVYLADILNNP